jgi:hypothetical protein
VVDRSRNRVSPGKVLANRQPSRPQHESEFRDVWRNAIIELLGKLRQQDAAEDAEAAIELAMTPGR